MIDSRNIPFSYIMDGKYVELLKHNYHPTPRGRIDQIGEQYEIL